MTLNLLCDEAKKMLGMEKRSYTTMELATALAAQLNLTLNQSYYRVYRIITGGKIAGVKQYNRELRIPRAEAERILRGETE